MIVAERLVRRFGSVVALDAVDLRVARGEAVALFGPNGAGKTTLIRTLSLGLRPASGSLRIDGLDPRREDLEIRSRIGVISHQSNLYDELSAVENLEFFARLYGVDRPRRRAEALLERLEISERAEDPVGTFSRGMQQRVSVARALIHDPPLLFLDEPFTGLDPHAASLLRETLASLRRESRTVLIATHNLREGLGLSDRWVLLSAGRIVEEGASEGTEPERIEPGYVRAARDSQHEFPR